jgi:DNA-binding FrmR family transcriptional regulator
MALLFFPMQDSRDSQPCPSTKALLNRLSRIQGQLEAIKKNIQKEDADCEANLMLLKASINGLKNFGSSYMKCSITNCLADEKISQKNLEKIIKAIESGYHF